jgi:hypothetical protein
VMGSRCRGRVVCAVWYAVVCGRQGGGVEVH